MINDHLKENDLLININGYWFFFQHKFWIDDDLTRLVIWHFCHAWPSLANWCLIRWKHHFQNHEQVKWNLKIFQIYSHCSPLLFGLIGDLLSIRNLIGASWNWHTVVKYDMIPGIYRKIQMYSKMYSMDAKANQCLSYHRIRGSGGTVPEVWGAEPGWRESTVLSWWRGGQHRDI